MTDNDNKEESKSEVVRSSDSDFCQIFLLNIELNSASDLIKADRFGKSDPYCKVFAFGQTYTTRTIMKNLNPVWNEKTQFCLFENPKTLKFEVWDWDKHTTDDAIGDTELVVEQFFDDHNPGFEGALTLQNVKKGQLTVKVQGRRLMPVTLENKAKDLQIEIASQLETIDDKNKEISDVKQMNANLTIDNSRLTDENSQLTATKNELEGTLSQLRNEEMSMRTEIDRLSGIADGMGETLNEEERETDNVANELSDIEQRLASAVNDNENLNSEIERLNRELEMKRIENETQKQEIIRARKEKKESQLRAAEDARAKESEQRSENTDNTPLVQQQVSKNVTSEHETDAGDSPTSSGNGNAGGSGCQCCVVL